jgi:predicted DNA-binding transcriptional regulator YafY
MEKVNTKFKIPSDFDAKTYLEETMRFTNQYRVVVRMDPEAAPRMRERADDWMQVSDNEDGSVDVRFDVDNLDWAAGFVLSWGKRAKVVAPPELAERVKNAARELLEKYRD